ncbi:MAG: sigma-70 family RNA polymerase sigma factor [Pseudomonadota bacterium]
MTSVAGDVDRSFREHYAELVAVLSHVVGYQHLAIVEDGVQSALMKALEAWTRHGPPANPSAWLYRVARNEVLMALRSGDAHRRLLDAHRADLEQASDEPPTAHFPGEVLDELLRMMLSVCDPALPTPSQIAFALKVLGGFSVNEIAQHLFTSEENVYKRLQRARAVLRRADGAVTNLSPAGTAERIPTVRQVLYAMFTEGHLSVSSTTALRTELCDEAIRLTTLLARHPLGAAPQSAALLALMHFHRARMNARQGPTGGLALLDEQDRSLWEQDHIVEGIRWLERSAEGDVFTRFHAEAGIAAEHCRAHTFADTAWERIVDLYDLLEHHAPSPVHRLNRALAIAEARGPKAGLASLEGFEPPTWLAGSYLWAAGLADLHRRCGHREAAVERRSQALASAPNQAVRALLERRLLID